MFSLKTPGPLGDLRMRAVYKGGCYRPQWARTPYLYTKNIIALTMELGGCLRIG